MILLNSLDENTNGSMVCQYALSVEEMGGVKVEFLERMRKLFKKF